MNSSFKIGNFGKLSWIVLIFCCGINSLKPLFLSQRWLKLKSTRLPILLRVHWQNQLQQFLGLINNHDEPTRTNEKGDSPQHAQGIVLRLAARPFANSSKPSSRSYTTRKTELVKADISKAGVEGDYNHYRTVALKSTPDRAISLLTKDVMDALRAEYPTFQIENGDLGENVLVGGVSFDFFRIGKQYKFVPRELGDAQESIAEEKTVILEITEKMEPCANLCKLSYINEDSLQPKERIIRCQEFICFLDRYDGYRGWYAKVVQEGTILVGAKVVQIDY